MAAHLERGFGRGIGALAALLQPTVEVRCHGGERALALVFTVLLAGLTAAFLASNGLL